MRTQVLLALSAAFSLFAAAAAAPAIAADAAAASMPVQIVPATPHHTLLQSEFDSVLGSYDMSNGELLTISGAGRGGGRTLFAQFGARGKTELVPLTGDEFVSRDGQMTLVFDRTLRSTDVTVTLPAR
jgi:hypothetical protein